MKKIKNDIPWYLDDFVDIPKIVESISTESEANGASNDQVVDLGSVAGSNDVPYATYFDPDELKLFRGSEQDLLQRLVYSDEECRDDESNASLWHIIASWEKTNLCLLVVGMVAGCIFIMMVLLWNLSLSQLNIRDDKKEKCTKNIKEQTDNNIQDSSNNNNCSSLSIKQRDISCCNVSSAQTCIDKPINEIQSTNPNTQDKDENNTVTTYFRDEFLARVDELVKEYGLDRDEATKVAVKDQKEKLDKLEQKAKQAKIKLSETIKDIFLGTHFMVCVIVGCGTRLLFAHQDFLLYFFRNGDEGSILGLGQEWVAINVCSCFVNDQKIIIQKDNEMMQSRYFFPQNIVFAYISSYFNSSSTFFGDSGECFIQICSRMIIFLMIHRFVTMLHLPMLHSLINAFIFILGLTKTSTGRSMMTLLLSIWIANISLSGIGCYFNSIHVTEVIDMKLEKGSVSSDGQIEMRLRRAIYDLQEMKRKMYIVSTTCAIALGFISFFTI